MTVNYIIIDDETMAHEIIEDYCSHLPHLKLQKNCYNAFEAMDFLNQHKVDLMFLDINMPKLSGFDFLKTLVHPPKVIVTSAYDEFALEGYNLDISDYLLKPFSLDRFLKAINRTLPTLSKKSIKPKETISKNHQFVFLKDGTKQHKVFIHEIQFIEAYGNYTKVHTESKTIVTHEKLSTYLELFSNLDFCQVHKSYIVSTSKIELIENNKIVIGRQKLPIGQTFKKGLNEKLGL